MSLKTFLQGFGVLAVILTLFPFVAADYWWIRMFDYPHVQLTILTLVAFLVYFFRFDIRSWRDYSFVAILAACFFFQLTKIHPYTPFSAFQVKNNNRVDPQASISILATNVLQKNDHYEKVLDVILTENPDLLIFTETDERWRQELSSRISSFGYSYKVEEPLPNTYGMLLYSRHELIDPEVKYLVDDSIPSIHTLVRLPQGQRIQMHVIHPTPPMPQHNPSSTDRDAEMMMVAKMAKKAELPVIVAGDFNDVAWSETTSLFQNVSQLLDPRIGRGFYNTYNANSWLFRWPLDHLFVSEEFRVVDLKLGNDIESDHFPLYAKLSFEPESASSQRKEAASSEEMKKAENQIEKEKKKVSQN